MNKFRFLAMSILSLVIIGLTGCKNDDEPEVKLTGITVDPTSASVVIDTEVTLKATAVPANAANVTFSWTATPADNVSITPATGAEVKVKGLKEGVTEVTVTSGGISKKITVTVTAAPVPLTGISLSKEAATLEVDGADTITAAPVPDDASGTITYTATSSPAGTVEVKVDGSKIILAAKSVGEADVTVTSGSFSKTIKVTVVKSMTDITLSKTVVALDLESTETVTATPVPEDASDVNFVWTVTSTPAAGVVEYTVATDGASITVTGKGSGTAVVTVTSGSISKTVSVSVAKSGDNVLQDALGYWEFEDVNALGKRTYGTKDLLVESPSTLTQIDGPSANNKAVQGVKKERELALEHGIVGNADDNAQNSTYTVMWDVQIPAQMDETWGTWFAAFWNQGYPNASLQFRYNNYLSLGMGSQGWDYVMLADYTADQPAPWMRVVAVIEGSEGDRNNFAVSVYKDGTFLGSKSTAAGDPQVDWRFGLNQKIYFLSDGEEDPDGRNDDTPHPLAGLAFWTRALDAAEIALLGGIPAE